MNIVNKLTLRNLKLNKKRTLVTIIGVIISAAMITAVATFSVSILDLLKRATIVSSGNWHALFPDISIFQITQLQRMLEEKDQLILSKDMGWSLLEGTPDPDRKPYVLVRGYNKQGFENYNLQLKEGRMPLNDNEIVITEAMQSASSLYSVGNTLPADLARRVIQLNGVDENGDPVQYEANEYDPYYNSDDPESTHERLESTGIHHNYLIVGVVQTPQWIYASSPAYMVFTYLDPSTLEGEDTLNASVLFNKVDDSIYTRGKNISETLDCGVQYHNELLAYSGVMANSGIQRSLYLVVGIVIIIIMVGSISLIYNAFAISVSDRSRQLGMMASVGATKKQKRNSVFFEGAVIGAIGIPLGILSGIGGMAVTFLCVDPLLQSLLNNGLSLQIRVSWASILVTILFSAATIFISTWIPARRASKITPVEAIRQTADIGIRPRDVKTSKLISRIFGFEAELGLKNLKRNRRRYKATIFSLIISVVLFLSVATFTGIMRSVYSFAQQEINFDLITSVSCEKLSDVSDFLDALVKNEKVTAYTYMEEQKTTAILDEKMASEYTKDYFGDWPEGSGQYGYDVYLNGLDEKSLEEYAKVTGTNIDQLYDTENPAAIVVDTVQYNDYLSDKKVKGRIIVAGMGESIPLFYDATDYDNLQEGEEAPQEQMVSYNQVTIANLTDQFPMGAYSQQPNSLNLFVSQPVLDSILAKLPEEKQPTRLYNTYLSSDDPMGLEQDIYELSDQTGVGADIVNLYQSRQQTNNMQMLISVFAYGFVVLIVAICIANIFNTISTSISLRRREFAMLQSVGMTPRGFDKMIRFESIFYGLKALLYGLPISTVVVILMNLSLSQGFGVKLIVPWIGIMIVIVGVFLVVGVTMVYAIQKVKKENIIETLKQENI